MFDPRTFCMVNWIFWNELLNYATILTIVNCARKCVIVMLQIVIMSLNVKKNNSEIEAVTIWNNFKQHLVNARNEIINFTKC